MTTHRFFVNPQSIKDRRILIEDFDIIKQISFVLRLTKGSQVIFLDNSGYEYLSEIKALSKKFIEAVILSKNINLSESKNKVILYQSITRKLDSFEMILQKCSELGVYKFVPVICKNSQRDFLAKKDRLQKIIKEATEQSERGILPELENEIKFENAVKNVSNDENALNLFCYERAGEHINKFLHSINYELPARTSLSARMNRSDGSGWQTTHYSLNLFIGPEGGFSEEEVNLIKSYGHKFQIISLGQRILRTETAAIAICSKILI